MYGALLSPRWGGMAERDIACRTIVSAAELVTDDAEALHAVRARQLLRYADASPALPILLTPLLAFKAGSY
jgi:hypothetical protein